MDQQSIVKPDDVVVFDLDGTLIDSAPDIHAGIDKVLEDDGLAPLSLADVTSFVGNGVGKLVERAYRHRGAGLVGADLERAIARFSEIYMQNAAVLTRPFPGVVDGLEMLRRDGRRLGICTNKPHAISESILKALDLRRFFDVVIGGDSYPQKKPDPAPLLASIEALGATAGRALYIGDSETDVKTARAAGVRIIAVTYGYPHCAPIDLGADVLIERIDGWASAVVSSSG